MAQLKVNGKVYDVDAKPHETLADVLRNELGLIGVKVSCGEGECGSCTVLLDGVPATSCLMQALQGEKHEITTIEGIGTRDDLHPIQQAFIDEQGFQCGFCTPGFIMTAKAFFGRESESDRRRSFGCNEWQHLSMRCSSVHRKVSHDCSGKYEETGEFKVTATPVVHDGYS